MKNPVFAVNLGGFANAAKPQGQAGSEQKDGAHAVNAVYDGNPVQFLSGQLRFQQEVFSGQRSDNAKNGQKMDVFDEYFECHGLRGFVLMDSGQS